MIPMLAAIQIRRGPRANARAKRMPIWIPLFLIWLLLAPVALLLLVLAFIMCPWVGVNPFKLVARVWAVLWALGGTSIYVDNHSGLVSIRII